MRMGKWLKILLTVSTLNMKMTKIYVPKSKKSLWILRRLGSRAAGTKDRAGLGWSACLPSIKQTSSHWNAKCSHHDKAEKFLWESKVTFCSFVHIFLSFSYSKLKQLIIFSVIFPFSSILKKNEVLFYICVKITHDGDIHDLEKQIFWQKYVHHIDLPQVSEY
jgi:hypothetical protein